jgi:hypothetical protein
MVIVFLTDVVGSHEIIVDVNCCPYIFWITCNGVNHLVVHHPHCRERIEFNCGGVVANIFDRTSHASNYGYETDWKNR